MDKEKKETQKKEMLGWQQQDHLFKEAKKKEEQEQKQKFIDQMMQEFERKEKLDQISQNKRRMKINAFKKEVQDLWEIKQQKYQEEILNEQEKHRVLKEQEEERKRIIEEEKRRLLNEHMPRI